MRILIINGPNLNFLGIRSPEIYGSKSYEDLLSLMRSHAKKLGIEVECFQSNSEGGIIDRIQAAFSDGTEGIVINPGAYAHYSYAIRDALDSYHTLPKVEVHISDINQREEFRNISVTAPVAEKVIIGRGFEGYLEAMDYIVGLRS